MNIDRLQTQTNTQPHASQARPVGGGWFAQMVEGWRVSAASARADAFGVDDELRDLGPSRHSVEREMGKAAWHG